MAERRTAAAAVSLSLACLLLAGCLLWAGRKHTAVYQPDETAFPNAQIGYAPGVLDTGPDEPAVTLRYLGLTWRELEPEEGVYAWEAIQQTCHLDALRQQGVHLVLRILCDEPGAEAHLDIPDWLYEKTGNGSWYDLSYGKGYSPDYADPAFFAAHVVIEEAAGGGGVVRGRWLCQLCGAGQPRPLGRVARKVRRGAGASAGGSGP